MKKIVNKIVYIVLAFSLVLTNGSFYRIYASSTNKVKYNYKNGVVRVYGKGNMPKTMTFKNNKKIKKVIIKNKVTKIFISVII